MDDMALGQSSGPSLGVGIHFSCGGASSSTQPHGSSGSAGPVDTGQQQKGSKRAIGSGSSSDRDRQQQAAASGAAVELPSGGPLEKLHCKYAVEHLRECFLADSPDDRPTWILSLGPKLSREPRDFLTALSAALLPHDASADAADAVDEFAFRGGPGVLDEPVCDDDDPLWTSASGGVFFSQRFQQILPESRQ